MLKILKKLHWQKFATFFLSSLLIYWNLLPMAALADVESKTKNQSIQPYLQKVIKDITEFRLDNGMKFIVLENHKAPTVSFVTYADVGGANEVLGKTGAAHYLEHLAFKGTKKIGTIDYQKEKELLELSDRIFDELKAAEKSGDKTKLAQLQAEFSKVDLEAKKYAKQNEFGRIVETAGGVGLNASTSNDYTNYFYSFPANKLELWMSLESERFLEPVFREFYKEREVIIEERRMRTDNSPLGKLIETFLGTAFEVHPYKYPVIGSEADIRNIERKDIQKFFQTYYTPSNLTMAIVGDVNPQQVKQLAIGYFGRFQTGAKPPKVTAIEPAQTKTKEVAIEYPAQPVYIEGYHIPALKHPDYPAYEVISALLSYGRTSRLYRSLVEQKQVALSAEGFAGFPGDKFPNLMAVYALVARDRSLDDVAQAINIELQRLKTEPVSEAELDRVKTQLKAQVIRNLDSNMGMANILAEYEAKTGSWRNVFKELDAIAAVTPADVQKVAKATFIPTNRTIGRLINSAS
ncbi:MAG: M16 family metallopeptidase [Xenococcaceae cyanobacterium]